VGDTLQCTDDPLQAATDMLAPLLKDAGAFEDTHLLAFDVYRRKVGQVSCNVWCSICSGLATTTNE
jgi:hypothetical protein